MLLKKASCQVAGEKQVTTTVTLSIKGMSLVVICYG